MRLKLASKAMHGVVARVAFKTVERSKKTRVRVTIAK
jgi:hypothetical protein